MRVLAIDSAMNGGSVAIYDLDHGLLFSRSVLMQRGQAEYLLPMIEKALSESNSQYSDLDLIAVTHGPGAFTGMRIGLSVAKSLALSLGIPVVGVCTFQAVLQTYLDLIKENAEQKNSSVCILLETKRCDYYYQIFDNKEKKACFDGRAGTAEDIIRDVEGAKVLFVGDASDRFRLESKKDNYEFYDILYPAPVCIARLAIKKINRNEELSPVYIRPPDISFSKKDIRTIDCDYG